MYGSFFTCSHAAPLSCRHVHPSAPATTPAVRTLSGNMRETSPKYSPTPGDTMHSSFPCLETIISTRPASMM